MERYMTTQLWETPTKKDPLKFRAIVQAVENAGAAEGTVGR